MYATCRKELRTDSGDVVRWQTLQVTRRFFKQYFGLLTNQLTAAGKIPACKVLVIGAGVAGLSAIATARRMSAIVPGFATRSVAREQV